MTRPGERAGSLGGQPHEGQGNLAIAIGMLNAQTLLSQNSTSWHLFKKKKEKNNLTYLPQEAWAGYCFQARHPTQLSLIHYTF